MEQTTSNQQASGKQINDFFKEKEIAIAGVSRNPKKFGFVLFNELRQKGFKVYPVNPNSDEIDGTKCYRQLSDVPKSANRLLIVTPKSDTDATLKQAFQQNIRHIWIQKSAESVETESLVKGYNYDVIMRKCILMYADPVVGIHRFHRCIANFFSKPPI